MVELWRNRGKVLGVHFGDGVDRDIGSPVANDLVLGKRLKLFLFVSRGYDKEDQRL